MTLQARLAAFKADFEAGKPPCNVPPSVPEFEKLGASLVVISPQTAPNSRKSARQNELGFPILSGPHNAVAAAFGLRFELPDYLVDLCKAPKNDLPTFNGDASWTLPMPARYVIAQDGTILYAEVNPDHAHRPEPGDTLPALRHSAAVVA